MVTLLTCTPYGVNSHRLMVRGSRVSYEEIEDDIVAAGAFSGTSIHTNYLLWVIVGLSVTGIFILCLYLYDRRRGKMSLAASPGRETESDSGVEKPGKYEDENEVQKFQMSREPGGSTEPENAETWRDDWPEEEPEGWQDDWPEEDNEKETD